MKKILLTVGLSAFLFLGLFAGTKARAGEVDVLVNKLVEKGVLSPAEGQIIADETKVQVAKDLAHGDSLSVPDWTQRVKWGGDVRYRTRYDSGKPNTGVGGTPTTMVNDQWQNQIRGRFYMEGKANDFTYAGVRLAGSNKADSTNDTVQNYWTKAPVYFDQYYMRFEAPSELIRSFGQYFSDFKVWAGRFPNPFNSTEMTWDPDINPAGVAAQYTSPDMHFGSLPTLNAYTNLAMLWLDENTNMAVDSILWAGQIGVKTDTFGPLASKLDISTAMYSFSNLQGQTDSGSAVHPNTNTLTYDPSQSVNQPPFGTWLYPFNVFDILISLDNQKIGDIEFPHGFYSEYINNMGDVYNVNNQGLLVGAYIGKKKPKDPGAWKARAEWRYVERDSIPDFMTDSDFYGFGTYSTGATGSTNPQTNGGNGLPVGGGTNGKGVKLCADYVLFKNTTLTAAYFWMKPIKSDNQTNPWNEVQLDDVTKF